MRFVYMLSLLALTGCQLGSYGQSANYHYSVEHPIPVSIPANAPSVIQQYRPPRRDRGREGGGEHPGIDIYEARGVPVLAAADGVVLASYREPSYGNRVVIQHKAGPNGLPLQTVYKHLDTRMVSKGDRVKRGQQIGGLGNSGILAAGILHLHFEVHETDQGHTAPRDPNRFWVKGKGQITCYNPRRHVPRRPVRLSYPILCKPAK